MAFQFVGPITTRRVGLVSRTIASASRTIEFQRSSSNAPYGSFNNSNASALGAFR